MNSSDPSDRLADLHTGTADDLDAVLDIEAGLREALVAAQHTRTHRDLDLDIEAGLHAIVPTRDTTAPPAAARNPDTTHTVPAVYGAVAAWLMSLDSATRLAARTHPAITALARTLEITQAAANVQDLARDLRLTRDRVLDRDRVNDLALDLDLAHAYDLANDLVRDLRLDLDLTHTRDLVRDLARFLDVAHARALDWVYVRDLAHALDGVRVRIHDLDRALDRISDRDRDLAVDPALAVALDRDLDRACDRDHAPFLAGDLDRACHDFTTADLRGVDLNLAVLTGVRWSMATRWPSEEWQVQVLLNSTELGGGVYEIRGGTTRVPTSSV